LTLNLPDAVLLLFILVCPL